MKIRTATSSDVPAMYTVDHIAVDDGGRRQNIRDWVNADQAIVAVVGNTVVGYSALEYTFFGYGFIVMLVVKKESRRNGVATALVEYHEQRCTTNKLFTSTNESNKPMQALMKNMRYEPSGTVYNLDEGDPELFYVKRLQSS